MAQYKFGEQIGSGGFAKVLAATRVEDGWQCAVKRLSIDASADDRTRFEREVRIQAKLQHAHIVPIIGYNTNDSPPWFVMPRAIYSLRDLLRSRHGEDLLYIFSQVADGIGYAHDNGIFHRDLKPENVLFFEKSEGDHYAAVGDFGLGRFATRDTPSVTQSNMRLGTFEYMAPEQYTDSKNATQLADIYALGKLLYELLTGQIPFPGMDTNLIPTKFRYIIQKACQNSPEDRYKSVGDLLNDFQAVTGRSDYLTVPGDELQSKIQEIMGGQDFSKGAVEPVARLLVENTDDNLVLSSLLPRLPNPVLESLLRHHKNEMTQVLRAYDETLSGRLPFEYCDVAADFYEKIFTWTDEYAIRTLILKRLPQLGYYHNRWHVGKVFSRVMDSVDDVCLLRDVAELLSSDELLLEWCAIYLNDHAYWKTLKSEIEKKSKRTSPFLQDQTLSEDDLPF